MAQSQSGKPRIVIIGGGFGGLKAARQLRNADVKVTLIDRKNHQHLSAAPVSSGDGCAFSRGDCCPYSLDSAFAEERGSSVGRSNRLPIWKRRVVKLADDEIPYDYLIVAAGASHAYFGHDEWEPLAPGLKTN